MSGEEKAMRDDVQDSSHTVGGAQLPAAAAQTVPFDQPNGWFAGPRDDPDRYELLGQGITGGEGVTWRARYHGSLESPLPLAVKVQHPPVDPLDDWPSVHDQSRWRDQTALMRHMRLDHVVRVNEITSGPPPHRLGDADRSSTESIIVEMEWVDGETLSSAVRSVPATAGNIRQRAQWITDACIALSQLHSHTRSAGNPTVHRDVTPANCIVTPERGLVLIDVSTMQLPRDGMDPAGRHTPAYSAPEVLAKPHSPRYPSADVYAIGALTFFCLTGQDPPPPISGDMTSRLESPLRAAADRLALGPGTVDHVLAMLAPEPDDRPSDLLAWSDRFRELATPRRIVLAARTLRRPLVAVPLVVAIAGGAAGTGWLVSGHDAGPAHTRAAQTAAPGGDTFAPVLNVADGYAKHDFYSKQGRIIRPASGAQVRSCEDFTGTAATLPPGQTLMVSQYSLSNPGDIRYAQVTVHYDHPETLSTWHSAQFFNDGAIGKRMLIELIQVPLPELVKAENDPDEYRSFLRKNQLALDEGKVLAAVTVTHVDKKNPSETCDVPPSLDS